MENLSEVYQILLSLVNLPCVPSWTLCTMYRLNRRSLASPLTSLAEPQDEPRQPPWNERNGAAT
jgi:hypothetical protein